MAVSRNLLGMIFYLDGESDQAAEIFNVNLAYYQTSNNNRGVIQTLGNLAITRQGQNQAQEALNLFGQAATKAKLYGSLVEQAQIEFGRGALYMKLGKLENAKISLERISAHLAQLQFVHPMLSQVQHNLGLVLLAEGN